MPANKTCTVPVLALTVLLCSTGNFASAELLLASNGIHFGPGDNFSISIGLNDTQFRTEPVDAYLAVIPPGSDTVSFISGSAGFPVFTPGLLSNPATWTPLAENVILKNIGDTKLIPYVSLFLPGGIPSGDYRIAFATTHAGTMNVVESRFRTVRILENSIRGNLGSFAGAWHNTTFGSEGAAEIQITEKSPGVLEGTLNLDGFVGGFIDPEPETRQVSLADSTGLIDYQTEDPLINGTYSLTLTPTGDISISVEDIGVGSFFSFTATGSRDGDTIELDYQVNSVMGLIAVGTVSGERVEQ